MESSWVRPEPTITLSSRAVGDIRLTPSPTPEDLLDFFYPSESDWRLATTRMDTAGFQVIASFNPYWNARGRTYRDLDGYRVVLQQSAWTGT